MSRILRHRNTEGDTTGWFQSEVLNTNLINEIKNPDEKTVDEPPRSIPSPFAPLDLARSAMERYVNGDESSQVLKILSDVLDVGVLFFTMPTHATAIDCVRFDFSDFEAWKNEGKGSQSQMPASMLRYYRNDGAHYGFDKVNSLYLLREKNNEEHVLGGTSPQTMFFVAPGTKNWARFESLGGDTLFDNELKQLHERYEEYVIWLYRLGKVVRQQQGGAETAFVKYIDYCLSNKLAAPLSRLVRNDLASEENNYQKHYGNIYTTSDQSEVEVYTNVSLLGEEGTLYEVESDYSLAMSYGKTCTKLPLALPQTPSAGEHFLIRGEVYDRNRHRPPIYDPKPLSERHLPGLPGKVYPYLTVDDWLEPYLLEIPYPADGSHFLTCYSNIEEHERPEEVDYLLPLKPAFFDYFTAADLTSNKTGTPSFTMHSQRQRGYVEIRLKIPVKGGRLVSFSRKYQNSDNAESDRSFGGIRSLDFGLAMYPDFVDRTAPQHQRLVYTSKESGMSSAGSIRLFESGGSGAALEINTISADWTEGSTDGRLVAHMLQPQGVFDCIRVYDSGDQVSGLLIPRDMVPRGSKAYAFAVDFGTTNTHIEVSTSNEDPQPLTIAGDNPQLSTLHTYSSYASTGTGSQRARELLRRKTIAAYQNRPEELLPSLLGGAYPVKLPIRTATIETGDIADIPVAASLQVCVPWKYQLEQYNTDVFTDLKWSPLTTQGLASKRAEAFIDSLCLVMRNYASRNGGRLADTKLVWFYPTSMSTHQKSQLGGIWNRAYEKYFGGNVMANVVELTESLAPMYAYVKTVGVIAGNRPAISVDIGGGSTDVAVWANGNVVAVDSFRLAGNAVFGDGEGYGASSNGFIKKFEPSVLNAISHDDKLLEVYRSIKGNSTNLINFWFGLRDHPLMAGRDFNFTKQLAGTPGMCVPFVIFFGAIAYRTAKLLDAKNLPLPRDLTFSGNGSRMLTYLSDQPTLLRGFFEKALAVASTGNTSDYKLKSVAWDKEYPKEITSKGGLAYLNRPNLNDDWRDTVVKSQTRQEVSDEGVLDAEVEAFGDFVSFMRQFTNSYSLAEQLGIAPVYFSKVWPILEDKLEVRTYMKSHITELLGNEGLPTDELGEKLFFFPLRRMLPRIAEEMAKQNG